MRRLFYRMTDLDDAAEIAFGLEEQGIPDTQFFVLCRDEQALRRRFLHGDNTLENTRIVAAGKRSNIFACMGLFLFSLTALVVAPLEDFFSITLLALCLLVFVLVKVLVLIGGGMYDDYFKGVFDCKLDSGDAVFVVDVPRNQNKFVHSLFAKFSSAELLVDCSNFASPLPHKKYIRRTLPNANRA